MYKMEIFEKLKGPRLYSRPLKRKKALGMLHELVELCRYYIFSSSTDPLEKIKWITKVTGLLSTNAEYLKDLDMDELKKRVSILEEFYDEEIVNKKIR